MFAVNFYATRNACFMLNHILVSVDDSSAVVDGISVEDSAARRLEKSAGDQAQAQACELCGRQPHHFQHRWQ